MLSGELSCMWIVVFLKANRRLEYWYQNNNIDQLIAPNKALVEENLGIIGVNSP